ncbi:signal recognition particle-docking protein FtsY [Alteromonas sp. 345S023]|uniref:Signal recognition particle receptor FtsY n=1 Tax=Alteromonas profundi TaxID=2696062 RepID=A0A7X5LMR3_9ALTE|nr:signal recognition particle-docking protein FtsY [Alteromonas profundi]NDV92231.1 signal recognition particle-docking protein FtsY [Alteromonas profundi]
MSKLFGWFSKNKKADKKKAQETQEQKTVDDGVIDDSARADNSDTRVDTNVESENAEHVNPSEVAKTPAETKQTATQDADENLDASAEITASENVTSDNDSSQNIASHKKEQQDHAVPEQVHEDAQLEVPGSDDEDKVLPAEEAVGRLDDEIPPENDVTLAPPVEDEVKANKPEVDDVTLDTSNVSEQVSTTERVIEATPTEAAQEAIKQTSEAPIAPHKPEKKSLFSRLKQSLSRTKANLGSGFVSLFKGKTIDDELYEDLETQLLVADVGMDTTQKIITHLTDSASRKDLKDAEALLDILKQQMSDMLTKVHQPLPDVMASHSAEDGPFVILMVGVNGVGKTTTIGKLAKQFEQQGKKVMLAAGDTFRAAAVEQLQVWGERNNIPVIAQHTGADSASVLYDALEAAKSRKCDVLIADTAGRLQNKNHLMEELKKVVRVMKKITPNAPHEVMLTLDAGTGQNAISQAKLFNEAVGLTGITLTKLDGTAKGGVIFSIADQFGIPIRYIGVGEGIDDLREFNGQEFIDALFSEIENGESAQ